MLRMTASGKPESIQINVGCGPVQPEGWVNIDSSNRARFASRLHWLDSLFVRLRILPPTEFGPRTQSQNVHKGLRFSDNSVSAVYSGEMLEHFTQEQGQRFLAEAFRVLAPGGVLRIRVPDNYRFWKNYVTEFERVHALPREDWHRQHTRWIEMFFRDICVRKSMLRSMGHYHKWMYDEVSLILAFQDAGFVEIARRTLHDSRIPDVALVETRDDLIVEGIKPGSATGVAGRP